MKTQIELIFELRTANEKKKFLEVVGKMKKNVIHINYLEEKKDG